MKKTEDVSELKEIARNLRIDILKMLNTAGSGHSGGSLSCVEILVSLYFNKMHHGPDVPKEADRDKFVLSKGHGAPALYAVLAECGYFPKSQLSTLRKLKSKLSGHPHSSLPGVEITTGSLGQGLSQANGLALAGRLNGHTSNIYCLMGDGELQEGMVWEAAMTASHYHLGSVIAFVDNNGLQIDGQVKDIMRIEPVCDKFEAFGWHVQEIDGHDLTAIMNAIDEAKKVTDRPSLIKARTVKGKGVSFMEGQVKYHGAPPSDEELVKALEELSSKAEVE